MSLASTQATLISEYSSAKSTVMAVTDPQITSGLAGLTGLATNVNDAVTLLRARQDALRDNSQAATINILQEWATILGAYTEGIRTLIHNIQNGLPA